MFWTHLEDTPGNTTEKLSDCKNWKRWSEEGDEDCGNHPDHEEHHSFAATKAILSIQIDDETD